MPAKVLFLGLDGADPGLMDEMMNAGELPTFKAVRDASRAHSVINDPAMGAAQFWTSASIGAGPGHHGHYFYMQFKPDTYDIIPNHDSTLPEITPFWNVLDRQGYKVGVIDWHRMMPKPMTNGFIIDNWLGHDPLSGPVFSPSTMEEVCANYFKGDPIAGGFACKPRESAAALNDYLHHLFNRVEIKANFCADQLRSANWDLFIACFSDAHDVGHYFYNLCDPVHELYDHDLASQVKEPLRACYRRIDEQVARLIEEAGPEARVFAYGGPGMEAFVSANGAMDEMIRRIDLGVGAPLSAAENAKKSYHSLIPKELRWTLAPLARAVRRTVAASDFSRRRFFAIPHNDNSGAVRVNVKGREKFGIVERGAEFDAVINEIAEGVKSFRNAETGRPLVKRVVCVPQLYDGPYIDHLPDLYVEWDRTDTPNDIRKIISDRFGEIEIAHSGRSGDHNDTGFFWEPQGSASREIRRPEDVTAPVVDYVTASAN